LSAFTKYPLESSVPAKLRGESAGAKKFGFFHSEKDKFKSFADKTVCCGNMIAISGGVVIRLHF